LAHQRLQRRRHRDRGDRGQFRHDPRAGVLFVVMAAAASPATSVAGRGPSGARLPPMQAPPSDISAALAGAVHEYRAHANIAALLGSIDEIAAAATADALVVAAEPYRDIPEVAGPIYEKVVAEQPENARALVILA